MDQYHLDNFEAYSEIFKEHALAVAELMKILNDQISSMGLPPAERTKDLFRMVLDLSYNTDTTYKKRFKITDPDFVISPWYHKDEVCNSMRSIFKEELDRYMGHNNENAK